MSLASRLVRLVPAAAAGLAALVLTPHALARREAPAALPAIRLIPDPAMADAGYQVVGRTMDVTRGGLRVRATPLEPAQLDDWFALRTREGQPPLPGAALEPFVVLEVSLENGTGEQLTFVSAMASMKDETDADFSALPPDTLLDLFRAVFAAAPDPMQAAGEALRSMHREALVLAPGQRATRLLVFPRPGPKAKRVVIALEHVLVGSREMNPHFSYLVAQAR